MNDKDIIKSAITQVQPEDAIKDRRIMLNRNLAKCFVNCNGYAVIDEEFADPLGIMGLDYESKAWLKVRGASEREVVLVLTNLLIERWPDIKIKSIKWSRTCGCTCGCSPGYNVNLEVFHKEVTMHNMWADVFLNEDAIKRIRYVIALQTVQHKIELQQHMRDAARDAMKELAAS